MKKLLTRTFGGYWVGLILFLVLARPSAFAQAPAWQTAVATDQVGFPRISEVSATTTDANGNVYAVGTFTSTTTFGNTTLTPTGNYLNLFVAKWSTASRSFVWAQQAGSDGRFAMHVRSIAVNGNNVYISGSFSGDGTFGAISVPPPTNPNQLSTNFIAKLTDAGTSASFAWVQPGVGASALAANGTSVYAAGPFYPTLTLGSTVLTNPYQLGGSFVTKFTDTGTGPVFVWAKQCGALNYGTITALAVEGANVYVSGYFYSNTALFDAITLTNTTQFAGGVTATACDAFVAKLTDAGSTASFTWAQQVRGTGFDLALALAVNGPSVYVAGYYGSNNVNPAGPAYPPASFGTIALPNSGTYDAFVAKITDAGTTSSYAWAQRGGGTGMDSATAVTVRGNNVYVAGAYDSQQADFGTTTLSNARSMTRGLSRDIFVTKLVDAGTSSSFAWAQQAGGSEGDYANSIALVGANVMVAGAAGPSASFGSQTINTASGQSTYNQVGFLASLTDPTLTATTAAKGDLRFSLAPNPARTTATVQLPAVPGATAAALTLTDALGRTLRNETVPLSAASRRHELDLRGLAPGLYAVQVQVEGTRDVQRLVVE
ncbi:T9SS type A sorting domain-containing protein [Hymenobacter properus]|uniref:T9SS type A sorting domain-containing protein n=1 Tax=Hymenobacter properus TaxID=2791026 RepID=A0A931BFS0_9BACT|nr:T9SS type A sorting domain-containing protein [Hymenobacter properus]MBF9142654.1 T9SS type A sorting domain-containing protein [Hymenobacter properus]MBR7721462.1 T9SS type A sorting domain-containing protein [Microvirga sp. SRT04]